MAPVNHEFQKRQRDLARKKKQEMKRLRKEERRKQRAAAAAAGQPVTPELTPGVEGTPPPDESLPPAPPITEG